MNEITGKEKNMLCRNCGNPIDSHASYCTHCGARCNDQKSRNISNDKASFGFAILGFFIPLAGLILFLLYEDKKPKRAKSAGKGALTGFIIYILIIVTIVVFTITMPFIMNRASSNDSESAYSDSILNEGSREEGQDSAEVTFGEFTVSDDAYYPETSLEVTVKNKTDKQCTFFITIEAVDTSGARIATDNIYADRLNPGQEVYLTAFEYVDSNQIDQFKNADFQVLEINHYES